VTVWDFIVAAELLCKDENFVITYPKVSGSRLYVGSGSGMTEEVASDLHQAALRLQGRATNPLLGTGGQEISLLSFMEPEIS
jgi:hypothetical protein